MKQRKKKGDLSFPPLFSVLIIARWLAIVKNVQRKENSNVLFVLPLSSAHRFSFRYHLSTQVLGRSAATLKRLLKRQKGKQHKRRNSVTPEKKNEEGRKATAEEVELDTRFISRNEKQRTRSRLAATSIHLCFFLSFILSDVESRCESSDTLPYVLTSCCCCCFRFL